MNGAKLGTIVLAGALSVAGACSIAGLDEYASGKGASGGDGGRATTTTLTSGSVTGSTTGQGGTGTVTNCDAVVCDEACVDTNSDPAHCGACGVACADSYTCSNGVCGNVPIDVSTYLHTCAVLAAGEVWCWGRNVLGEIGVPPASAATTCPYQNGTACQTTPSKVDGIVDAVEVATGADATCARTASGEVWCWGSNDGGLLGHAAGADPLCTKAGAPNAGNHVRCMPTPTKVDLPPGVAASQLVMGSVVACIRTTTKDVYCWGSNKNGEIQSLPGGTFPTPVKNANVQANAEDIAISIDPNRAYSTVCVRKSATDTVECWGQSVGRTLFYTGSANGCAQAYCNPNAKTVYSVFPQQGTPVLADKIQVGAVVGCALRQGTVSCWGNSDYGQNGNAGGVGKQHFDLSELAGISGAVAISNRFATTMILDGQGRVWALGFNAEGQLGDGAFGTAPCPGDFSLDCVTDVKKVPDLTGIAKVVSGANNGAAITTAGKLLMWGANNAASLGHEPGKQGDTVCQGTQNNWCNPVPQPVTGLP